MKDIVSPAARAAAYIAGPSTNPLEALLKIYECVFLCSVPSCVLLQAPAALDCGSACGYSALSSSPLLSSWTFLLLLLCSRRLRGRFV